VTGLSIDLILKANVVIYFTILQQHVRPNVLVGIEILRLDNPTGQSYNGDDVTSQRRCCDGRDVSPCPATGDICDLSVIICIGE